jgi:hypothetical protein
MPRTARRNETTPRVWKALTQTYIPIRTPNIVAVSEVPYPIKATINGLLANMIVKRRATLVLKRRRIVQAPTTRLRKPQRYETIRRAPSDQPKVLKVAYVGMPKSSDIALDDTSPELWESAYRENPFTS